MLVLLAAAGFRRTLAAILILDDVLPLGPHPLEVVPAPRERSVDGLEADLYAPAWGRRHPGLILVNGAVAEGRKYPPLVGAARAVARAGYAVLVPELGDVRALVVSPASVEDLVKSIGVFRGQPEVSPGPIGLYGFSLGGSLALLAAEDPRTSGQLAFVADLGGYYRLSDMIRAATTQTLPGVSGVVRVDPLVSFIAINSVIQLMSPGADRVLLTETLRRATVEDPLAAFAALRPDQLTPVGRPVLALIQNRDGARADALILRVDPLIRQTIDALSPATHLERIGVPVWVLHDENDPFVPSQESRLLAQDPRGHGQIRLSMTMLLKHTEFLDLPALTPRTALTLYLPNLLRLERFVEEPLATL